MTVGERIKARRKQIGMSAEQVAQQLNISPSTVYRYENGDIEKMGIDKLTPIANALQTTPAYLMGWEEFSPHPLPNDISPLPPSRTYPLVGDIACGTPILAEQNITEYINFPGDLRADFCLRCRGDSMTGARIYDGDIVFVRQQPDVEDGEIAVVLIEEETTLKRIYRADGVLTLMPDNPAYPPMVYTGSQLDQIRILGKAVHFLSAVK